MGKKSSESPLASFRFTGIAILRSLRWEKAALAAKDPDFDMKAEKSGAMMYP